MNKQLTPETMTPKEQIKSIINTMITDADTVCRDKDQRRAYLQGARQMTHALYMDSFKNDVLKQKDMKVLYYEIHEKVQKTFAES